MPINVVHQVTYVCQKCGKSEVINGIERYKHWWRAHRSDYLGGLRPDKNDTVICAPCFTDAFGEIETLD